MNKVFKKKRDKIILLIIFLVAFIVRFFLLDQVPSGFHSDEAAFGFNAYSLLETGKDEYATPFPLILKSFDDYKGAFYAYLTIPSIAVFGLTEFATRLPTALFGFLLVVLSYLLTFRLTRDKSISLLVSFLTAVSPISIFLSRVQSDPLVSVFLMLLGFYTFLIWMDKNKIYLIIFSSLLWIISIYTYPSPRVLLPVLFFGILIFYFNKLKKLQKKILLITLVLVMIINTGVIIGASQRLKQLSVFNAAIVSLPMEEKIREDTGSNVLVTRLFHNKVIDHAFVISKNYFDYFTYDFLFLKGGQPDREKIPGVGILYLFELPFLLYGIYLAIRNKEKWGKLMVFFILLFPLALSFAVDESPNVHRYFINIFFLEVLVALGIIGFIKNLKNTNNLIQKTVLSLLFLFIFFNFSYFIHQLFIHQPRHQPWYRGYAYKELVLELDKIDGNYKKIVFTKQHASPYIYVLFFKKINPQVYQEMGSPRDLDNTGFDNYIFVPKECPLSSNLDREGNIVIQGEKDTLYINSGSCPDLEKDVVNIKTINWKDNNPAFKLVEYVGKN